MKKTVFVEGMMCQHCMMNVASAIAGCKNIEGVKVNLEKGTAEISFTKPVSDDEISRAVEDAGYKVTKIA
ncbi:MAG: heavy-metal-associated domain-containing protein [Clostridia bacterium]|nr:heavy-metal-associated domain-containing protein [Clostridia bacterium]